MKSFFDQCLYGCTSMVLFSIIILMPNQMDAQITPPGYEREKAELNKRPPMTMLDRDSVTMVDHVKIYDTETNEETVKIVTTRKSLREYCLHWLGVQDPDKMLDGQPIKILNPNTYEEMTIKLNLQAHKIDTIPN